MKSKIIIITIILSFIQSYTFAQFKINEASNSNGNTIILSDGSSPDWIEIYNSGALPSSISGWGLSDNRNNPLKWVFPEVSIDGNQFLMVYATNNGTIENNSINFIDHFETAVFADDIWQYYIPVSEVANWNSAFFNSGSWLIGQMSIGFGDGDDATEVSSPVTTLYFRITFEENDISKIKKAILDIDFDDGFVAYINGIEIAREGLSGYPPAWNELAVNHEANIYQGGNITSFEIPISTIQNAMVNGTNVLSIELHNTSESSSDLTCIPYLTFGYDQQGIFHNGTVHQYFNSTSDGIIETNFGISTSSETIYLSDQSGIIIDSLFVPDLEPNMSCGKQNDGENSYFIFPLPTPNSSNNSSSAYNGYENKPQIVNDGGVYQSSIIVNVVNNSINNGVLRYTTNGTNPETDSPVLLGPITLSTNCVLKVVCFPDETSNLLPSLIETETFLFQEDFTLPIISLTIDDNDLYGDNGIFDNWWTDWKKPCFMEYFDENGIKQFESRTSVKIDGGAGGSRSNPQHSMTVEPANSTYGEGEPVHYQIMSEKPYILDFYSLYLRNGSNHWNQYPQKDATFCRLMKNTYVNYQEYTPTIVYLNGEYFGIYEIREKANEGYFENNYGNNLDSLDLLSVSYFYGAGVLRTVKGSDSSFYSIYDLVVNSNPANSEYFEQCNQKLDLLNFADYIIAENWIGNTDWIYNNMKLARARTYDNKWKFFLQDLEWGLGGWTDFYQNMFDHFRWENQPNPFWDIYNGLIQNEEFKNYFINRYADLMNTNLKEEFYKPMVDTLYMELLPEFPRHLELWTGDVTGGMETYNYHYNNTIYQFANRNPVVREQIIAEYSLEKQVEVTLDVFPPEAGRIKISTIIPENLPWTGVYFDGNPVVITAIPNPGYTFENWEANACIPFGSFNKSLNINVSESCTFTANFSGTSQQLELTFSEINYHSDSTKNAGDWIEIYNPGNFPVDISDWYFNDDIFYHKFEFPTGFVIEAGDYVVLASDNENFSNRFPDILPEGNLNFDFNNAGEKLILFDKDNNPIIQVNYEDSIPWPICADGNGRTLELKDYESDLNNPANWYGGCIEGSPGTEYFPCEENLIFSEINYKSSSDFDAGDWVEVYNTSNENLDLSGYVFKDDKNDHNYTIPQNTIINSQEYLVLFNNGSLFTEQHPDVENKYGPFNFGLNGSGEVIRLYDNNNQIIFSMAYQTEAPWPIEADGEGYTLEYDFESYDFSSGESWFAGCPQGSPGTFYVPCGNSISELDINTIIYPNPAPDYFYIKNMNLEINEFSVEIINISGQTIYSTKSSTEITEIDISSFNSGFYLVKIISDGKVVTKKLVKE